MPPGADSIGELPQQYRCGVTEVRAAVAQARAIPRAQEAIEKVALLAHEATEAGAQLVVFPEALLGGYPRG
jgi:nitrilase